MVKLLVGWFALNVLLVLVMWWAARGRARDYSTGVPAKLNGCHSAPDETLAAGEGQRMARRRGRRA